MGAHFRPKSALRQPRSMAWQSPMERPSVASWRSTPTRLGPARAMVSSAGCCMLWEQQTLRRAVSCCSLAARPRWWGRCRPVTLWHGSRHCPWPSCRLAPYPANTTPPLTHRQACASTCASCWTGFPFRLFWCFATTSTLCSIRSSGLTDACKRSGTCPRQFLVVSHACSVHSRYARSTADLDTNSLPAR